MLVLIFSIQELQSSENKDKWECDPTILDTDKHCVFVRLDDVDAGPHNVDRRVGADGFRKVVDIDGRDKGLQARPMDSCDILVESGYELEGNELRYV